MRPVPAADSCPVGRDHEPVQRERKAECPDGPDAQANVDTNLVDVFRHVETTQNLL